MHPWWAHILNHFHFQSSSRNKNSMNIIFDLYHNIRPYWGYFQWSPGYPAKNKQAVYDYKKKAITICNMNRDVPVESVKDVWIMAGHGGVPLDDYMQSFIEAISLFSQRYSCWQLWGFRTIFYISHHHTGVSDHLRSSPLDMEMFANRKILCLCWSWISFLICIAVKKRALSYKKKQHYFEELLFHTFSQKDDLWWARCVWKQQIWRFLSARFASLT